MMQFIKVTCFPFGSLFFFFFPWSDNVVLNPPPSPELLSSAVITLTYLWLVSLPAEEGLLHLLLSPVLLWANQGRNLKTHIWQWFSSGIVQELPIWVDNDLCSLHFENHQEGYATGCFSCRDHIHLLPCHKSEHTIQCYNQSTSETITVYLVQYWVVLLIQKPLVALSNPKWLACKWHQKKNK